MNNDLFLDKDYDFHYLMGSTLKKIVEKDDVCAASAAPKPLGKRKINVDTKKNNDLLQKRMRLDTSSEFTYCYTFEKINLFKLLLSYLMSHFN